MKDYTTVTDTAVEITLPSGRSIRITDQDGGFYISTTKGNFTLVVEGQAANAILLKPIKRGLRNLGETDLY